MTETIPDHLISEARNVQSGDSPFALSSAASPLKIPELLEMILDMLPVKDNVSAARVCHTWKEPALDRIWRSIGSLVPLFRLIGPMTQGPNDEWTFLYDIKHADWSRYAVYAPRIREVTIRDYDRNTRVSTQCTRAVSQHLPSHLRRPRPTSVTLYATAPAAATLSVILLISKSLRKLNLCQIRFPFPDAAPGFIYHMRPVVEAIMKQTDRCKHPCLEELKVCCKASGVDFIKAFNKCLTKHGSRLTSLTAKFPFDGQAWASIFGLSALQNLDIAPSRVDELRTLEETMPMIQNLVERQPQLKALELDLALRREPSQSNSPYFRLIHGLMRLRDLETLILHVSLPLSLHDSEVKEMGASWPKMRILQFNNTSNWIRTLGLDATPQSDLSLLPSFLRGFPGLEELHVPFICEEPLIVPQEGFPVSPLRTLDVGKCPTPKASEEEMVAYLAAILPRTARLSHRNVYGPSHGPRGGFWKVVARDLAKLREAA